MVISVASGKGGTGKTTIAVNLALSLENQRKVQFFDCDVEEPNAAIFLKPEIKSRDKIFLPKPKIDLSKCNFCQECSKRCTYNAIAVVKDKWLFFPELCHSCGLCQIVCPTGAISETPEEKGIIESGKSGTIDFYQGVLKVGEASPVFLIRTLKKKIDRERLVIIDVSPGTACSMVEAVKGTDFCLLVTEPTPFGKSDLGLAIQVLKDLRIPSGVVINKAGKNDEIINDFCAEIGIPVLMQIPLDRRIAVSYSKGNPLISDMPEYKDSLQKLFFRISSLI